MKWLGLRSRRQFFPGQRRGDGSAGPRAGRVGGNRRSPAVVAQVVDEDPALALLLDRGGRDSGPGSSRAIASASSRVKACTLPSGPRLQRHDDVQALAARGLSRSFRVPCAFRRSRSSRAPSITCGHATPSPGSKSKIEAVRPLEIGDRSRPRRASPERPPAPERRRPGCRETSSTSSLLFPSRT